MSKQTKQVKQFHEAFNHPVRDYAIAADNSDFQKLRYKLMLEELEEYKEAIENNDIVAVADALTDLQYVLSGTFLAHGLHPVEDELFDEVHRSNMSKLQADGTPLYREDGKILKGENYSKPNLNPIVEKVCKNKNN